MTINNSKKIFVLLIALAITCIYLAIPKQKKPKPVYYPPDSIQCFYSKSDSLSDISYTNPAKDKSIFFHETSCNSGTNGKIVINARQACAVESAARSNPNFEIYLLYSSPGLIISEGTESDHFIEALQAYKNVKIHHLDFELYVENTPVENLFRQGRISKSKYAVSHSSDVLRYLTLWKYGGIYLDLDVVVLKSLEDIPLNFAGAEWDGYLGSAVLGFEHSGIGHNLSDECLKDLRDNFSGTQWSYNGPGVVTRLAQRICGTREVADMVKKKCLGNFTVYPAPAFYPVHYASWNKFFSEGTYHQAESYVAHIWNKLSHEAKLSIQADVPYVKLAKEYCPEVFRQCEQFF